MANSGLVGVVRIVLKKRLPGLFLTAFLAAPVVPAAVHAATMDVLLRGHDLRLEYAGGAVILVTFTADGRYTTSTGSSGTWTLEGEKLCTVRRSDKVSGCGRLPLGKLLGATWTSTDADGVAVTASIVRRR